MRTNGLLTRSTYWVGIAVVAFACAHCGDDQSTSTTKGGSTASTSSSSSGDGGSGGAGGSSSSGMGGGMGAGQLDMAFGNGGIVLTDFGYAECTFVSSALQPDGKVILAGQTQDAAIMVRIGATGELDTTFGNDGVTLFPAYDYPRIYDVVVEPDGRIDAVVGARNMGLEQAVFVARYLANGTLDTTFGEGGIATYPDPGQIAEGVAQLARQSDGKIIVALGSNPARLGRLLADGKVDTTFGMAGSVVLDVNPGYERLRIAIASDDSIVVAVDHQSFNTRMFRCNAAGALDTSFDGDGRLDLLEDIYVRGLSIQSNGRILVALEKLNVGEGVLALAADGSVDTAFGEQGLAKWTNAGDLRSISLGPSDTIVGVGTQIVGTKRYWTVGRWQSNGLVDTTFASNGLFTLETPYWGFIPAGVEVRPDSAVVVAGTFSDLPVSKVDIVAHHLSAQGVHDDAFSGGAGSFRFGSQASAEVVQEVRVLSDGKILAAGTTYEDNVAAVVARYLPTGALDTGFGTNGKIVTDEVQRLVDMDDRKDGGFVLLVGHTSKPTLMAYDASGQPDTAFGSAGIVDMDAQFMAASGVMVDGAGRLLVGGQIGNTDAKLYRLMPNGTLDTSFGMGGSFTLVDGGRIGVRRIVEAEDKSLYAVVQHDLKITVVHLLENGAIDTNYGTAGIASTVANFEWLGSAVLEPNGKLLVTAFVDELPEPGIRVARFTMQGTLDLTFGTNGTVFEPLPGLMQTPLNNTFIGVNVSMLGPSLVLRPGGGFYLSYVQPGLHERLRVRRYDANGQLDTSFAEAGLFEFSGFGNFSPYSSALQPTGELIVAGRGFSTKTGSDFALWRLLP